MDEGARARAGGSARRWAGPVAAAVAAVLLAVLAWAAPPRSERTVAARPGRPAPVPAGVTAEGWVWSAPGGAEVVGIEPGSHGPLVLLDDGLVALDGRTGEPLWTHRYPGEALVDSGVLDGGRWAYVLRHAGWPRSEERRMRVLDPGTGGEADDFPLPGEDGDTVVFAGSLPVQVRVGGHGGALTLAARDPRSDRQLWDLTLPGGGDVPCEPDAAPLVHGDTLLVAYACAEPELLYTHAGDGPSGGEVEVTVLALEARTGERVWSRAWPVDAVRWGQGGTLLSPGGPPVTEGARTALEVHLTVEHWADHVLDPATGEDAVRPPDPGGLTAPGLVHADTATLVHTDHDGTVRVHRTSAADGRSSWSAVEGVDPAQLAEEAVALVEGTVLLAEPGGSFQEADALVVPAAEGSPPYRIPLTGGVPTGTALLRAVPGAVVVAASGGYGSVHGLVP
ncbi:MULTISPECIES: PQQ-binding-like beta-propeller repeat protein [unclassified Nocardiopsis]|uniref:PQQ-binding-like beta-propeller repeat protein n=1 Tax=unclassified Nocardiopsis TaxID=2649073 RepID=UPI0013591F4C|nr:MULTISPECIES: PQQ-binding-like beta-propeller repeat protein [unclassified Nocardiopsis]